MNTTQIINKLAGLTKQVNDIITLGKRFDEFPAKEILDPASKILVSTDGISETLLIKQIIDSVNNESQDNKVRAVMLGTISVDRTFAYILDTTGLTVAPDENVILSVLDPIDGDSDIQQYRERVFLWKLGKGTFGPIGSEDLDTKLFELPSIYPTEESAEDLVNSPEAIVRDYGVINVDILEAINTSYPAVDYDVDTEDIAFTYYVRATLEDVKYLYQFRGENGIYGFGAGQMASEDLVLIYSSSNTGTVDGSAYVTRASIGDVIIDTDETDIILPNRNRFGFVLKNTGNSNILGIGNTVRNNAFPVGTPVAIANRSGVDKTLKDMVTDTSIRPFELPFGDMVVENNTLAVFKNTGSTLLFQSYSKMNTGPSQAYVDAQDAATLNAAKSYSDTQDTATLNAAKTYAECLVTALYDLRGLYNPTTNANLYPTAGGSGPSGVIKKGDVWVISGLAGGVFVSIGTKIVTNADTIMALEDAPGNIDSKWNIAGHNLTYTPENIANKVQNFDNPSANTYPSTAAVLAMNRKRSFCLYGPDFSCVGSAGANFMAKFGASYAFTTSMGTADHNALLGATTYSSQLITPYKCKISNIQMDLNTGSYIANTEISIWGRNPTAVPAANAVEYLYASKPGTQTLGFSDVVSNVVIPANTTLRIYIKNGSSLTSANNGYLNIFFEEEY